MGRLICINLLLINNSLHKSCFLTVNTLCKQRTGPTVKNHLKLIKNCGFSTFWVETIVFNLPREMNKLPLLYQSMKAVFKKRTVTFISCSLFFIHTIAQTPIQGVVNTYHKVLEIVPAKACIIVDDPTGLSVNNMVMLIQMKGAVINTTNTAAFGDITNMNNAGNYEIGTICYIIDDSVFLFHNLLNNYTPANGKVQLVQFAEYNSAEVTDTLKALPWDSTKGTGGVIALYAINDIILNAPIYTDSSGFRGGIYLHHSGTCSPIVGTLFAYDASSTSASNGAYKGEGISNIPGNLDGGKGAPANGGGGGNNHNNSGGGGANLSIGGLGGGNSSSGPFNCTSGNRGQAGKALNSFSGQKIFFGGGGGAGHSNNGSTITNYGGNGGGLVFIWATTLTGNGEIISANGGNGGVSSADGAGGGGGGGTIIMNVTNYVGSLSITATGGNGGNSVNDNSIVRCFGGGGGGSGGAIYFMGAAPPVTINTTGGSGGVESNRNAGCSTPIPGVAGNNGNVIPNYTFSRSFTPASYCRFLLPVKLISFNALAVAKKVQLEWQIENPELAKYYIIEKINSNNERTVLATVSGSDVHRNYSAIDNNPSPGSNQYRLKIIEKDNSVTYSEYKKVFINYPGNEFSVYPNPATNKITINGNFTTPSIFKITDISGRLLLQQPLTGFINHIGLPPLSPGVYLLHIGEKTQKLIIQ